MRGNIVATQQMFAHLLSHSYDKKVSSYRMSILPSNLPLFNDEYADSIRQATARAEAPEYRKPVALRLCITCKEAPRRKTGSYCDTCNRERVREYARTHYSYERERDEQLRINYGISMDEYSALSHAQDDVCAICKRPEAYRPGRSKRTENVKPMLHVDHDHATGKIRGLLCSRCNNALGNLQDDPKRIKAMLKYLGK